MSESAEAASGEKPSPIRIAPVTATRGSEARRALEKCAERERNEQQLQPPIRRHTADPLWQGEKVTRLDRQAVQEHDIENDPADRKKAGDCAQNAGAEREIR